MTRAPILFFHSVDADNLNPQSGNTKEILARWDAVDLPAATFFFKEPDERVARNTNVRLIKLPPNRLWKPLALIAGLGSYSAIVYPGLAARFDHRVQRLRRIMKRGGAVVSTFEGLLVSANGVQLDNEKLSAIVGHRVYGQPIPPDDLAMVKSLKRQSDMIISISPFLQQIASDLWPEPISKNIPLGVNLGVFHPRGRIPHGANMRVRVVGAGNLQPTKRPELFLHLARKHPEADFTWYGEGERRGHLLERVQREALHNVFFPGPVRPTALADAFRSSDIFVLPSIAEGVPKVTQEAAACGLPVVCMNYYEPFSVEHGRNGLQAEDDNELFRNVANLIMDAETRKRMGANSAKMALNWSWDTLAPYWQEAICEAVLRVNTAQVKDFLGSKTN